MGEARYLEFGAVQLRVRPSTSQKYPMLLRTSFLLLLLVTSSSSIAGAQATSACDSLVAGVREPARGNPFEQRRIVQVMALEVGASCILNLEQEIGATDAQYLLPRQALAIATIGGHEAVAALRRLWNAELISDTYAEHFLVQAAASSATSEDIEFLIGIVVRDSAATWLAESAAYNLGLLRAQAARTALQEVSKRPWGAGLGAVESALEKLAHPPCISPRDPSFSPRENVVVALLDCVSQPDATGPYCDIEQKLEWVRENLQWRHQHNPECRTPGSSIMRVDLSSDRTRAMVDTAYNCGVRCGGGFVYLLSLVQERWVVRSVMRSYIS